MIPLTVAQVMQASGARAAEAERFLPFIQGTCKAFDITSPRRIAGFLSQMGHESAGFTKLTESLDYSVEALLSLFKRHRISEADARKHGRTPYQKANQEAIANCLYGGQWGLKHLGNVKPGDGWKHRGRGAKQLTGLDNHRRCGEAIGEDFVNHPERLTLPVNAILSGGWFWAVNKLNAVADDGDIKRLTREVNGGDFGLERREALFKQGMAVFA